MLSGRADPRRQNRTRGELKSLGRVPRENWGRGSFAVRGPGRRTRSASELLMHAQRFFPFLTSAPREIEFAGLRPPRIHH